MLRPLALLSSLLLGLGCSGSDGGSGANAGSTSSSGAGGGKGETSVGSGQTRGGAPNLDGTSSTRPASASSTGGSQQVTSMGGAEEGPSSTSSGSTVATSRRSSSTAAGRGGSSIGPSAPGGSSGSLSNPSGGMNGGSQSERTTTQVSAGGSTPARSIPLAGGSTSAIGGRSGASNPDPGACDPGTSTTNWATDCPTAAPACTAGSWVAGGPDPDHSGFALKAESDHFAVYSDEDISASTAQAATAYLENTVWPTYFGAPIYFRQPLCKESKKYKASIHVHSNWGLTGGAWGSNRMGMWIGTGGLSDHWGLAHEFMHSVQSVSGGQSCNASNTCGWVYESHANFMPHQLAEYRADVHCSEMLVNTPHLYLGSTRDRYCNWQFMEFLKDKHCYSAVNAIWTGSAAPDPFTGIMAGMGWNIAQLNDFIGEWAMHNVTWDYENPPPTKGGNQGATYRSKYGSIADTSQAIRRLRLTKLEPLDARYAEHRRFASPSYWAPQRFGYNVVRLYPEAGASSVTVTFRGVTSATASPDWRWGLVATDSTVSKPRYSALQKGSDGSLTFCVDAAEPLFLVVAATPSTKQTIIWDQAYNTVPRYPYMVQLSGAWPEGFRNGSADPCPSGLTRATNGGGCAPSGTTAYVGPYATVLSGATVSGTARIEDHATVVRGTVSGGTVGAMTLIGNSNAAFTMTSGTAKTTFYPIGFFEGSQGLSGGSLIGDVEYRGAGLKRTSGTCSGFVDSSTCLAPGTDNTPAPPYEWR